jgi:hypothetical protein
VYSRHLKKERKLLKKGGLSMATVAPYYEKTRGITGQSVFNMEGEGDGLQGGEGELGTE